MQDTVESTERRYFDTRAAENYTGLSRWTLARASKRGELRVIKVGSAIRYDREDLDSFMRGRRY